MGSHDIESRMRGIQENRRQEQERIQIKKHLINEIALTLRIHQEIIEQIFKYLTFYEIKKIHERIGEEMMREHKLFGDMKHFKN